MCEYQQISQHYIGVPLRAVLMQRSQLLALIYAGLTRRRSLNMHEVAC